MPLNSIYQEICDVFSGLDADQWHEMVRALNKNLKVVPIQIPLRNGSDLARLLATFESNV